jgi:hypothetical protein
MGTKQGASGGARPSEVDRLVELVRDCLTQPRRGAEELVRYVAALRSADWESRLDTGPRVWERFCVEVLGCKAPRLQRILDGAAGLRVAGLLGSTVAQALAASWGLDP